MLEAVESQLAEQLARAAPCLGAGNARDPQRQSGIVGGVEPGQQEIVLGHQGGRG